MLSSFWKFVLPHQMLACLGIMFCVQNIRRGEMGGRPQAFRLSIRKNIIMQDMIVKTLSLQKLHFLVKVS